MEYKFLFVILFVLLFDDVNSSPFDFIRELQGAHRGSKAQGITKLKKYLEEFGYLHDTSNVDLFDDNLVDAVKSYQRFFRISETGRLDAATAATMMRPRCGWADVSESNQNERNHINTVSHYTFFSGNRKWPSSKTTLTYKYGSNVPTSTRRAINRAFRAWANATHFKFNEVRGRTRADINVGYYKGRHGDGASFDGPGGILAHAFAPKDGRCHLDAAEAWSTSTSPVSGRFDVMTVAAHEIGHTLGLGHSQDRSALMYPSLRSGAIKGISEDDIAGIKALYGK